MACLPTSAPDSVIPVEVMLTTVTALTIFTAETPSTTIPPRTCPEVSDMASIFMASNVQPYLLDAVYGAVSPVSKFALINI
uniref:Secreted protein n=1 Tax=Panagrellus redivivus TaxID=6233 RepID=A0A7E4W3C1_PANRE